jgi:hypothetical protein
MRCLESARLLSERRDRPLALRKRMGLRVHLFLCALCRTYEKQLIAVCNIAHQAGLDASSHAPAMPPERRKQIQDAIERDSG